MNHPHFIIIPSVNRPAGADVARMAPGCLTKKKGSESPKIEILRCFKHLLYNLMGFHGVWCDSYDEWDLTNPTKMEIPSGNLLHSY